MFDMILSLVIKERIHDRNNKIKANRKLYMFYRCSIGFTRYWTDANIHDEAESAKFRGASFTNLAA